MTVRSTTICNAHVRNAAAEAAINNRTGTDASGVTDSKEI